jgi:hypothetical protein
MSASEVVVDRVTVNHLSLVKQSYQRKMEETGRSFGHSKELNRYILP